MRNASPSPTGASPRHRGPVVSGAVLALAVSTMLLAGCGGAPNHDAPAGTTVVQDRIAYSVEGSRDELNPLEPDDRALLTGLPRGQVLDAPHEVLVGVFVQAQNVGSQPHRAVAAPRLVSAEGDSFLPLPLPAADPFAYRGRRLAAGAQIPDPESAPAEDPEQGAVLVYRVPDSTFLTDRPFRLQLGPRERAASVQLDL